ncbi:hypothetical protein ACHAW6_010188 [Cyclotella cf. meneghiniana]
MAATRASLPKSFLNFLAHDVANERGFHSSTLNVAPLFADELRAVQSKRPLPIRNHMGRGCQVIQFSCHSCTFRSRHLLIGSDVRQSTKIDPFVLRSLQIQTRWKHSESSNASPSIGIPRATQTNENGSLTADQSPSPTSSPLTKQNRKSKRRKANFSALHQITTNHPKSSTSPLTRATLTRKQLLRLTQKQRATLKLQRMQQHKQSITYLDRARSNVRSNLKYLKGTAESNLKKNIQTIQRLFRGEEVWKDEETINDGASSRSNAGSAESSRENALHWDRLPDALRTNLQRNLSTLQNWLHKVTDGMIPSSSSSSSSHAADAGGSIAIRLHKFHEAKQNQGLIMDNKWIAGNVGLALLPGLMVHLYCLSKQDEMKEFYAMMEEREREKILGVRAAVGGGSGGGERVDGSDGKMGSRDAVDANHVNGGMGLSSALITEGGDAWDKIKMAVNDLFLGGLDEKVKLAKEAPAPVNSNVEKSMSPDASASDKASQDNSTADPSLSEKSAISAISDSDAKETIPTNNPTTGKRVGMNADNETNLSAEEQRHLSHNVQHQIDRLKQSPVQNRRDDFLAATWRKQEEEKKQVEENVSKHFGLQTILEVAMRWLHNDSSATVEWVNEKMLELVGKVPVSIGNYVNEKPSSHVIPDAETSNASDKPVMVSDDKTQSNQLGDEEVSSENLPIDEISNTTSVGIPRDILYQSDALVNNKTEGRLSRWWSKLSWKRNMVTDEAPLRDCDKSTK